MTGTTPNAEFFDTATSQFNTGQCELGGLGGVVLTGVNRLLRDTVILTVYKGKGWTTTGKVVTVRRVTVVGAAATTGIGLDTQVIPYVGLHS